MITRRQTGVPPGIFQRTPRAAICFSAAMVLLIAGCSGPPTPVEIEDAAKAGHASAQEGCETGDPKMAERGARQVETALKDAEEQVKRLRGDTAKEGEAETPELKDAKDLVERVKPLAREAREWADLAEEEKRCKGIVKSLRAAAYRTARKGAVLGLFQGLALAADQAGKKKPEEMSDEVRAAADTAGNLAGFLGARQPAADGVHDWPGIAEDMRTFSKEPPIRLNLALAFGFIFLNRPRWALYEIEALDPDTVPASEQALYCTLRGMIYRLNGCPRMAAREFEGLRTADVRLGQHSGPEIESGLYLLIGLIYLSDKQYKESDVWLMRAGQAWPNCPLMVFLTGERLTADGEWEKAAESLETSVKDEELKWVADMIARRARQIRDQKEETTPLILDTGFLWDLSMGYLSHCAKKSEPAGKLKDGMTFAKQLASDMLSKLPSGGKEEE